MTPCRHQSSACSTGSPAVFPTGQLLHSSDGHLRACASFQVRLSLAAGAGTTPLSMRLGPHCSADCACCLQAGTPTVTIGSEYNSSARTLTLKAVQENKHASTPQLIPLAMGLLGSSGRPLKLHLKVCFIASVLEAGRHSWGSRAVKPRQQAERCSGEQACIHTPAHSPGYEPAGLQQPAPQAAPQGVLEALSEHTSGILIEAVRTASMLPGHS